MDDPLAEAVEQARNAFWLEVKGWLTDDGDGDEYSAGSAMDVYEAAIRAQERARYQALTPVEQLTLKGAVFLVQQFSFDYFVMHDGGTQDEYEAAIANIITARESAVRAQERERYQALVDAGRAVIADVDLTVAMYSTREAPNSVFSQLRVALSNLEPAE